MVVRVVPRRRDLTLISFASWLLNKNPAVQLRRSETRFRSSGAGSTLPVSIPRNAAAQLKMADNHGTCRTTGRN